VGVRNRYLRAFNSAIAGLTRRQYDDEMDREDLEKLTAQLLAGDLSREAFLSKLATAPTAELGDVMLDLDRRRRCGFPEVVFGQSKSVETLVRIFRRLLQEEQPVLATRVETDKAAELLQQFPGGRYNAVARTFRIDGSDAQGSVRQAGTRGLVSIVTAGTSDMAVAEEVRETADWMGAGTDLIVDVGVAGPQRLLAKLDRISKADAVVVVAGMEAALASVVGGHMACPVVAVPTSVGYGASLGGIAALLGMLNSCAANVSVVNIDAGFKAGYIAGMIAIQKYQTRDLTIETPHAARRTLH
jgi:pyridinium-3,5-biscarboxylic acid mononucleotide synthase